MYIAELSFVIKLTYPKNHNNVWINEHGVRKTEHDICFWCNIKNRF